MKQTLPDGNVLSTNFVGFKEFLTTKVDAETGFLVEVDLEYPMNIREELTFFFLNRKQKGREGKTH